MKIGVGDTGRIPEIVWTSVWPTHGGRGTFFSEIRLERLCISERGWLLSSHSPLSSLASHWLQLSTLTDQVPALFMLTVLPQCPPRPLAGSLFHPGCHRSQWHSGFSSSRSPGWVWQLCLGYLSIPLVALTALMWSPHVVFSTSLWVLLILEKCPHCQCVLKAQCVVVEESTDLRVRNFES